MLPCLCILAYSGPPFLELPCSGPPFFEEEGTLLCQEGFWGGWKTFGGGGSRDPPEASPFDCSSGGGGGRISASLSGGLELFVDVGLVGGKTKWFLSTVLAEGEAAIVMYVPPPAK